MPFMVLPVFATNIKPVELVDEAFLRRIHYKVAAENPTADDFKQIWQNCCRDRGLGYDGAVVDDLLDARVSAVEGEHPRMSAARPHRAGPRAGAVPRRARGADCRTPRSRLRDLLRR